jgi:hypothetical protein
MSHSLQIKETDTSEVDVTLQVMICGNKREEKVTENSSLVEEPLTSTTHFTLQKTRQ